MYYMKILLGNELKIKKFFKISDLKILFVKDCKSKKCKMWFFFVDIYMNIF